ncbi:serine/threonine-protein kinase [Streptomyces sp. NPDC056061]|uniref:serine/threonine-protein kinase n=1 Tax=Streptomyces sp. NPDC056061 TaxID=3345700 RepID=UPI0035D7D441
MAVGSEGSVIEGRFELLERLGGGGMGLVWRARDIVLHREVALKEVRPPDPELLRLRPDAAEMLRKRVLREAISLARVSHPNVVTIYHVVDSPEVFHPWLVMELVPGGSFQDRLERGLCTPTETAQLGRGVLGALNAAHTSGILHRDVKPGNVLLRADGTPVLTDFGIAAVREATSLTNTGELIGSPDYMAPERLRGHDEIPSSDLWSLAMMLFVAVEGYHPMRRSSTLATPAAILEEEVPAPRRAGALGPVLRSVLVKDVAARPDAEALDLLLAEAAGDRVVTVVAGAGPVPAPAAAPVPVPVPDSAPDSVPASAPGSVPASASASASASAAPVGEEPGVGQEPVNTAPEPGSSPASGNGTGAKDTRADGARTGDAEAGESGTGGVKADDAKAGDAKADDAKAGDAGTGRTSAEPGTGRRRRRLMLPVLVGLLAAGPLVWQILPSFGDGDGDDRSAGAASPPTATHTPPPTPAATPSSSPSASTEPPEAKVDLLTPSGAREVVRAWKKKMGRSEVIDFDLNKENASGHGPVGDGEVYETFSYEDGEGTRQRGGGVMKGFTTIDLARVNWDALPRLIRVATTELGIRGKVTSYYLHMEAEGGRPVLRLIVSGDYGGAYLMATPDGTITKRRKAD